MKFNTLFSSVIIAIFLIGSAAHADVAVQYKVSRTHGLIKFVMAITGEPHITPNIKEAFDRSKFAKDPQVLAALQKIASVQNDLHIGMNFDRDSAIKGRRDGMDVISFINIQSIFASSVDDLSLRLMAMMPLAAHNTYFSAVKELDHAYEEIFWRSSVRSLYKAQGDLEAIAKKVKLNTMFKKAEKFYDSSWPADTPFLIGLYPVPFLKNYDMNQSSSQSLGNIEEHGVMTGDVGKDRGSFGVIFHELCHSLYNAQNPEAMNRWEGYFDQSKSPYRLQAHAWMNETLATILGNGWAYQEENGQLDKSSWYNHPIIDPFSRELYPQVMEYLKAGKALDQELVNFIIDRFAKLFPDSIYEYSTLLNRLVILSDDQIPNQREFISKLRENFSISGIGASSPLEAAESISEVKARSNYTLMLVFSGKSKNNLKRALAALPELGPQSKMLLSMKPRQILSYQDKNARTIIAIQAEKSQDLLDAVAHMSKNKIDPKKVVSHF